ncbi:MAG: Gfo/Idh/MocA family oxidoreductase [Armatimonadota bacterium]
MAQETKLAFIGAGGNAQGHMQRAADIEGVNIIGICDLVEEKAEEVATQYDAASYTDYHAMIEELDADAFYVSVPPFAHEDAEILAAEKGAHVFVEKPVIMDIEKGLEIAEAIDKAGVLSCVGYQLRLLDSVQRARRYLSRKTIGMVSSHRWGGLPQVPWWRQMHQSGGQLHEQTTHQVDLMRYLAGEIVEVYAHYSLRVMETVENFNIPDAQGALFKFHDGAIGTVVTSPMMTQGGGLSDLRFLVEDHILEWGVGGNTLTPDDDDDVTSESEETMNIDEAFVEAIRNDDSATIPCSYRSGLQTAAVSLAANESAKTGKPVEVPRV